MFDFLNDSVSGMHMMVVDDEGRAIAKDMITNIILGSLGLFFLLTIVDKLHINIHFVLLIIIFIGILSYVYFIYIAPNIICRSCVGIDEDDEDEKDKSEITDASSDEEEKSEVKTDTESSNSDSEASGKEEQ